MGHRDRSRSRDRKRRSREKEREKEKEKEKEKEREKDRRKERSRSRDRDRERRRFTEAPREVGKDLQSVMAALKGAGAGVPEMGGSSAFNAKLLEAAGLQNPR